MPGDYGEGTYGSGEYGDPGGTGDGGVPPYNNVPQHYDRDAASAVYVVDREGDNLAELNTAVITDVSFVLNDIAEASFEMPAEDPYNAEVRLGYTEIIIISDGVLWWGVATSVKTDAEKSTYHCEELLWYYSRRYLLHASLLYTSVDQLLIATGLHDTAQSGTNGDFNISTGSFALSGRIRSREYDRWQHPNILDSLKEFPTVDGGFDFGIEYDLTGLRTFNCYFPRKGAYLPDLRIELGRNIAAYSVDESVEELATLVYATGGSNGEVKFEENFSDDAKAALYGTRYEAITSYGSELDVGWLQDKATQEVYENEDPTVVPTITCSDEPVKIWGVVTVGDSLWVKLQKGRININNRYRVLSMKRNPSARTTDLTFIDDF